MLGVRIIENTYLYDIREYLSSRIHIERLNHPLAIFAMTLRESLQKLSSVEEISLYAGNKESAFSSVCDFQSMT